MHLHKLVGYIQIFLDLEKDLCYDKYVGAALGSCPLFNGGSNWYIFIKICKFTLDNRETVCYTDNVDIYCVL